MLIEQGTTLVLQQHILLREFISKARLGLAQFGLKKLLGHGMAWLG